MALVFTYALLTSCTSEAVVSEKNKECSFELKGSQFDTCNKILYGLRQGKWYIYDTLKSGLVNRQKITDTLYYRNDTIISN